MDNIVYKYKEPIPVPEKIIVPTKMYNISSDSRLLIPFVCWDKIGFMDNQGNIIVKPQYTTYYGECYSEDDVIKVTIQEIYGFPRNNGNVATYQRSLYGLINSKGKLLFEPVFCRLIPAIGNKQLYTVQNRDSQYGVITTDGEEIVPFGKYHWIDGFDKGLARVILHEMSNDKEHVSKWGLIDEKGNVVLPIKYDNIWNFYDTNRGTTRVIKGNIVEDLKLLSVLNKETDNKDELFSHYHYDEEPYGTHFGEFEGSYAQDVMGYSDDLINDAFEGDPDNYWNID